jgi:hypothetical protein
MIRQSTNGGERKNRRKKSTDRVPFGSRKKEPAADLFRDDEIDPADFFDPEEFGIRRDVKPFRP